MLGAWNLSEVLRTARALERALLAFAQEHGTAPQIPMTAVHAFQRAAGLREDGLFGADTYAALLWFLYEARRIDGDWLCMPRSRASLLSGPAQPKGSGHYVCFPPELAAQTDAGKIPMPKLKGARSWRPPEHVRAVHPFRYDETLGAAEVTYTSSPPGMAHTKGTIKKMAELARAGSETYEVRHLATEITRHVPSRSPREELFALYKWVRDNIRYRYDPLEIEWVQAPWRTVLEGAGDCDDITTLLAALAGSLGHPWRFRTVGPSELAQAHVQVQVFDREKWLDLDPVLEPTQRSTAPRTDLGMFGCRALGSDIHWSREGTMMGATHRRRGRVSVDGYTRRYPFMHGWPAQLGAPASLRQVELANGALSGRVTAQEATTLWRWSPYFQPPQPARSFGPQLPAGQAPTTDLRYRTFDAPGYYDPGSITFALPTGALPESQLNGLGVYPATIYHTHLGAGFLKKVGQGLKKAVTAVHQANQKIESKLQEVAKKVPVLKPFVEFHQAVSQPLTNKLLEKAHIVSKTKGAPSLKQIVKAAPGAALAVASKAAPAAAVVAKAPAVVALVKPAAAVVAKAPAALALVKAAPKAALVKAAPALAIPRAPVPALRTKYPKNARMLYDAPSKTFRVFVPQAAGLSGLGRPTFTVSFGGLGSLGAPLTPAQLADVNTKARAAVAAILAFQKAHGGKAPAVRLPAVHAFQVAEGMLSIDGLYGTNTRAALLHYVPGAKLPDPVPALRAKAITWAPRSAGAPLVAVKPAPAPVKPVIIATPKPVPSPNVPGYVEVGRETQNPGLPPVGAPETIVGAAQGSREGSARAPYYGDDLTIPGGGKVVRVPVTEIRVPAPKPKPKPVRPTTPGGNGKEPIVVTGPKIEEPVYPITEPMQPVGPRDPSHVPMPYWPPTTSSCGEDDNTLLWLFLAYLYSQRKKRAA